MPEAFELNQRDRQTLQMLADGEDYRQVCVAVGLTLYSFKNYAKSLYDRLGADNKTHAVAMALRRGLIK